ncbi:MAG TPA: hypothetical protein VFD41_13270 [Actinomycetales bacterium]|nr:hypothetical protein [Actinomycetales bacterium]
MSIPRPGWRTLAIVLAGAGALHFVRPRPYASIVPDALGDPYPWVYASGVAQIACAAALVPVRTRRRGAVATALLFVAVFPANIQMAVDALSSARASDLYKAVAVVRLPLQVPLVLWAVAVARRARRPEAER